MADDARLPAGREVLVMDSKGKKVEGMRLTLENMMASSRGWRRVVEEEEVVAAYEGAAVDVAGKILMVTAILGAYGYDLVRRGR